MSGPTADRGLQLERTALAWRRTALGLVAAGAIGARLVADDTPGLAAILVGVAVAVASVTVLTARGRYSRGRTVLAARASDGRPGLPGHGLGFVLVVAQTAGGSAVLAWMLVR